MKSLVLIVLVLLNCKYAFSQNGEILSYKKINQSDIIGLPNSIKYFGGALTIIGDIDKNGIQDFAIRAYDESTLSGNVIILLMNENLTVKTFNRVGPNIGGFNGTFSGMGSFGGGLTLISDIDKDGINEIAVGNSSGGGNNIGEVFILFLNEVGVVKRFIRIGSNFLPLINNENFGFSSTNIGDIDKNGVDDIAISSRLNSDGGIYNGIIYFIKLNIDGTPKSYSKISSKSGNFSGNIGSPPSDAFFATSITSITDLNKDGIIDIVASSSNLTERAIWILFLDSNMNVKSYQKIGNGSGQYTDTIKNYENFGIPIGTVGDLDGDGNFDIVVSSIMDSVNGIQSGRVRILFLNSNGTVKGIKRIDNNASNFIGVLSDGDYFGSVASGVLDLKGDFKNDLLIGVGYKDDGGTDKGAIYLLNLDGAVHPTPPKALWRVNATTGNQNTVFNFTQYSTGFPSAYKWSISPNTFTYQSGTSDTSANPIIQFSETANYSVQLKVINPFSADSLLRSSYINVQKVGIKNVTNNNSTISIYPNPTNGLVQIQSPIDIQSILVFDITGKQLLQQAPNSQTDDINISNLPQGLYQMRIETISGVLVKKVAKQ